MTIRAIEPAQLKQWRDQGRATLVDVRESAEFRARHIAEAFHIPLGRIDAAHLPKRDGVIVVQCLKGGRGRSACEKLLKQNPDLNVFNLEGGIHAWIAAGLPIESDGSFILPLDRQVQLTIGLMLILASGLTAFWNPLFIFLVAIIGTGLTIAGGTSFCGLARLVAPMPWNQRSA
jgi:rhodanese-related sulfurtransferase